MGITPQNKAKGAISEWYIKNILGQRLELQRLHEEVYDDYRNVIGSRLRENELKEYLKGTNAASVVDFISGLKKKAESEKSKIHFADFIGKLDGKIIFLEVKNRKDLVELNSTQAKAQERNKQFHEFLQKLGIKTNLFHLIKPEDISPILERALDPKQIAGIKALLKEGYAVYIVNLFSNFGLDRFSEDELDKIYSLFKNDGAELVPYVQSILSRSKLRVVNIESQVPKSKFSKIVQRFRLFFSGRNK